MRGDKGFLGSGGLVGESSLTLELHVLHVNLLFCISITSIICNLQFSLLLDQLLVI